MSDFNLDSFLAAQQEQGVSQGEGDFTISHEKARAKMTRYSLPREHSWVLKLVQAAVGWGCSKLVIHQTRTESTFIFYTENEQLLPSNDALITALLRADFDSQDPSDRFGTALRVVVERAHLSFHLQVGEQQAIYAGVHFSEMGEKKRAAIRETWTSGVTLMIHHISHTEPNRLLLNFIPMKRHGLPIISELEEYAYACPIPIKIDGRWIDGALRSSKLNWCHHRKPLRIDGLAVHRLPNLPITEGFGDRSFTVQTSSRRANRKPYEKKEAEVFVIIGLEVERYPYEVMELELRSRVNWICDGVIVQSEQPLATKNVNLRVYANASGLKTDLTSFHLVDTDEFRQRRRLVYQAVAQFLFRELEAERDVFAEDEDEKSLEDLEIEHKVLKRERREMAAKVALGSLAFATLTGPAAPGTALTGLAASAYVATRKVKRPDINWEVARVSNRYTKELEALAVRFMELAQQDQEKN